jgi:hypothetical protein
MRDAAPALGTLLRGLGQVLLSPLCNHWGNGRDAEFGCLLNGPLHAIKLVHRQYQRDRQRRVGLHFGNQVEANFVG